MVGHAELARTLIETALGLDLGQGTVWLVLRPWDQSSGDNPLIESHFGMRLLG